MPIATLNDIELCFETHGSPEDEPLVLVTGYTAQLTGWPDGFIHALVDRGFHVIRFDNRDAGLSSKSVGEPPGVLELLTKVMSGTDVSAGVPYTLSDMASDVVGLLDHLDIERAHVVGTSMGGMIVQHLAIEHDHRLVTATSIMSTTGDPEAGFADPAVMAAFLKPVPDDHDEAIAHALEVNRLISGPMWNRELAELRTRLAIERSFHPSGAGFQMAAIAASGDRTEQLADVDLPFLVIHGAEDELIPPSGGRATADAVPGADLLVLDDMGHDLPEHLWNEIVDAISTTAGRGSSTPPLKTGRPKI